MKFNFPNCKTCNQTVGTSNYSGQCANCHFQSGEKIEAPAPKRFTFSKAQWIDMLIVAPIIAILLFAGACKAYDLLMQRYMENSLASNVTAAHMTREACEASYQLILQYKQDNHISLVGSGDPCPLT